MKLLDALAGYYRRSKTGLTRHITILLINFGVIPLAILFIVLHVLIVQQRQDNIAKYYQALVDKYALRLGAAIEARELQLLVLTQLLATVLDDHQAVSQSLARFQQHRPDCLILQYYPVNGERLLQVGNLQGGAKDAAGMLLTPGAQAASAGKRFLGSQADPEGEYLQIVQFFLPVTDQSRQLKGILMAGWDGRAIWHTLEEALTGSPQRVVLIDEQGKVLGRHPSGRPEGLDPWGQSRLTAALIEGQSFVLKHYEGPKNEPMVGVGTRVPFTPWGLIVEETLEKNQVAHRFMSFAFLAVYYLSIVAALVLGKIFSERKILRPLRELRGQMTSLAGTPLEDWPQPKVHNEIEAMGKALTTIREELQRTMVSRDLLAQEVAERQKVEEELRRSEATLANIFRTVPLGLGTISNLKLVWGNENLSKLTGYELPELLGQGLVRLFPDSSSYLNFLSKIEVGFRQSETMELEVTWKTKDGRLREILLTCSWIAKESPLDFIFTAMDITARKRLEAETLKLSKLESLSILAGGLAHDFNNILTIILGHLELLRLEAKDEPQILRRLVSIEEASIRARNLSQQLLTFAKGGMPLKKAVNLADYLPNAVSLVLSGSKCAARFALDQELWPVEIDADQIQQALNNILLNAEQAMPAGGIIEIKACNHLVSAMDPLPLAPGRYVQISITDHGSGIAPEHLPRIFDPYFTTKEQGSGLGLTTTYSIIKNHQGHIAVESEVGKGTTFHLFLPATSKEIKVISGKKTELLGRGHGRILVLDDEKEVREVISQMLQKLGYEPTCVSDGKEVIRLYQESLTNGRPFDAVILDLTVPGGLGGGSYLKGPAGNRSGSASYRLQRLQ